MSSSVLPLYNLFSSVYNYYYYNIIVSFVNLINQSLWIHIFITIIIPVKNLNVTEGNEVFGLYRYEYIYLLMRNNNDDD